MRPGMVASSYDEATGPRNPRRGPVRTYGSWSDSNVTPEIDPHVEFLARWDAEQPKRWTGTRYEFT